MRRAQKWFTLIFQSSFSKTMILSMHWNYVFHFLLDNDFFMLSSPASILVEEILSCPVLLQLKWMDSVQIVQVILSLLCLLESTTIKSYYSVLKGWHILWKFLLKVLWDLFSVCLTKISQFSKASSLRPVFHLLRRETEELYP